MIAAAGQGWEAQAVGEQPGEDTQPFATEDAHEAGVEVEEESGTSPQDLAISLEASEPLRDPSQDLWLYRDRTIAILRRYLRLAIEVGRLPSLLGREFFRTRVTSYHTQTFEDSVIFVHDVEVCLDMLGGADKLLIAMVVLQEHTHEETARRLQCTLRTVARHFAEAVDHVTEIFLTREILTPLPVRTRHAAETCQGVQHEVFAASTSSEGKNKFRNRVI